MFSDRYEGTSDSLVAPARFIFSILPDDAADLLRATKAIYVGVAGDLTLKAVGSPDDVVFTNVAAGTILPVRVQAVRASGTTAGSLVGLA